MNKLRELLIELRTNIVNCNITNTISSIKYWCERIDAILSQPEAEPRKDIKAVLGKWLDHGRYTVCGMRLANGQRAPCHCGLDAAIESLYAKEPDPPPEAEPVTWSRMVTAPKDGTAILVLVEGSDVPRAARWIEESNQRARCGAGWYLSWDDTFISEYDGPRYWMPCPNDPDEPAPQQHAASPAAVARHKGETPETAEAARKASSFDYPRIMRDKAEELERQRDELRAENERLRAQIAGMK